MDLCNKVLSKAPISWIDVQKQLLNVIQARGGGLPPGSTGSTGTSSSGALVGSNPTQTGATIASSASLISVNKLFVKQCTDLLIKHIKNLNQTQVITQLENLALSSGLLVFKAPSEEEPSTVNAFLNTDDFYFEVSINISGEITDVKFSIFSEPATSSSLLKDIFCSWNWDLLSKHIEGIKANYILTDPDHQIRAKGFKSMQCLEKDLNTLYQIQIKYLDKLNTKNLNQNQIKTIDKLINQTPIGIYKKSELGEPLRLYYYLSPLDLIQHHQNQNVYSKRKSEFDSTYKIISSLTLDELFKYELGSYLTVSLQSTQQQQQQHQRSASTEERSILNNNYFKLPDSNLLILNENEDERNWHDYLNPYLNSNFNFEKNPLFYKSSIKNLKQNQNQAPNNFNSSINIPGTYAVKLNKPIVMCLSTLNQLQSQLGVETFSAKSNKLTPFFELLAKTAINNKILNDAYSVQLPDENQVYYITELDQPNCMGVIVDKLLFTHPQELLLILETLRKQLLFNELLLSCMRKLCTSALSMSNNNYNTTNLNYGNSNNTNTNSNVRILEIGLMAPFVVSIIMQHPKLLCYTTIEIDVSKGNIETRFRDHNDLHNPNVISEIIRRCHSIPVTIRALLMKYKQTSNLDSRRKVNNNNNNNNNSSDGNGHHTNSTSTNSTNNHIQSNSNTNSNSNSNPSTENTNNSNFMNDNNDHFLFDNTPSQTDPPLPVNTFQESFTSHITQEEDLTKAPMDLNHTVNDLTKQNQEINPQTPTNSLKAPKNLTSSSKAPSSKLLEANSSSKKRKASSSSSGTGESSLPSTPSTINTNTTNSSHPPSAKRKMTSSSLPQSTDIKRHNSLNEDSIIQNTDQPVKCVNSNNSKTPSSTPNNNINNNNNNAKKQKLKTSQSSIEISTPPLGPPTSSSSNTSITPKSTSENSLKKSSSSNDTSSSSTNSQSKSQQPQACVKKDKESSVLTAAPINSNNSSLNKSSSSSSNLKDPNKSKSTSSTPTSQPSKKPSSSSSSSTPKQQSSSSNTSQSSRSKPSTDESTKTKSSKDNSKPSSAQKPSSSSSLNSTPTNKTNLSNLSATEIQLKQPQSLASPQLNTSLSNPTTLGTPSSTSSDKHQSKESLVVNNRTPSPSSLSSLSISPLSSSNKVESADDQDQSDKKLKPKQIPSNPKSTTPQLTNPTTKPNTPPMQPSNNNLSSFTLSIGLGSSLKGSSFKIPHKAKSSNDNEEDLSLNSKIPLSASSPIPNNTNNTLRPPSSLGSPNKSSSSPQHDSQSLNSNKIPSKNSSNTKSSRSYTGNSSPRHVNNYESSTSNQKPTSSSSKSSQRSSSRPLTPIPAQSSTNRSNSYSKSNTTLPPVPLMSSTSKPQPLMPLMSFSSLSPNYNSRLEMTPSSPSPQDEKPDLSKSTDKKSTTPQPPDSPVCETAPAVIPKLIPLERNSSTVNSDQTSNAKGTSKLKSKAVEIASPDTAAVADEEDDDNLVIDLVQNPTPTFATRNLSSNNEILSAPSPSTSSSYMAASPSTRVNPIAQATTTTTTTKSPCILEEDLVNEAVLG